VLAFEAAPVETAVPAGTQPGWDLRRVAGESPSGAPEHFLLASWPHRHRDVIRPPVGATNWPSILSSKPWASITASVQPLGLSARNYSARRCWSVSLVMARCDANEGRPAGVAMRRLVSAAAMPPEANSGSKPTSTKIGRHVFLFSV
jgi:hypothetical protein